MNTKILFLIAALGLTACNSEQVAQQQKPEEKPEAKPEQSKVVDQCAGLNDVDYLITGQSNAMSYVSDEAPGVDWSYFEDMTGFKTYNIAVGGKNADWLRRNMPTKKLECMTSLKGVIYIHGEADAVYGNPKEYRENARIYLNNILRIAGAESLYLSTVGYQTNTDLDSKFDAIRGVQRSLVDAYDNWYLAYDDARFYRDWGLLDDHIHFNEVGDQMIMDAMAQAIWSN